MPSRLISSPARRKVFETDKRVRQEVRQELERYGDQVIDELKEGTSDWSNKPSFTKRVFVRSDLVSVEVVTSNPNKKENKIFKYVDQGTDGPYYIFPKKRGGRLKFQTGYDPKTQSPGKFKQGTGLKFGSWVTREFVIHPGIEGRNFIRTIMRKITPDLRRRIENAFRRALRRN